VYAGKAQCRLRGRRKAVHCRHPRSPMVQDGCRSTQLNTGWNVPGKGNDMQSPEQPPPANARHHHPLGCHATRIWSHGVTLAHTSLGKATWLTTTVALPPVYRHGLDAVGCLATRVTTQVGVTSLSSTKPREPAARRMRGRGMWWRWGQAGSGSPPDKTAGERW